MRLRAGLLALPLLLTSCGNLPNAQAVTLVVFKTACATTAFLDVAFQQAAAGPFQKEITAADVAAEAKWMGIVNSVCAEAPADITAAYQILIAAQQAMTAFQTGTPVPTAPATVPAGVLPAGS